MKKEIPIALSVTFFLSICSISYELILAQALTAFLGNTVVRYCTTIGLYLFSMGIGSFLVESRFLKKVNFYFRRTELFLSFLGGSSIVLLYFADSAIISPTWFSFCAHSLIIVIGVLTGIEIPVMINVINKYQKRLEHLVLSVNALGTFVGTLLFAFIFYKQWGLLVSVFSVGILNLFMITIFDFTFSARNQRFLKRDVFFFIIQCIVMIMFFVCLMKAQTLNQYLFNMYVTKG
jgi:spermidine synthase